MKFYKLVEITEDEYVDRTRDLDYDMYVCSKRKADSVYPEDKVIYIAMQDDVSGIDIDLDFLRRTNMTKEQELEIKNHLQALEKDAVIDLYLQKCFDTDVQLAEKDKEINFWKHKLTLLLNDSHIRIWTDVYDSEGNVIGERFFDTADKVTFMTNSLREQGELEDNNE